MKEETKRLLTVCFLILFIVVFLFAQRGLLKESSLVRWDFTLRNLFKNTATIFLLKNRIDIILIILMIILISVIFTTTEFKQKKLQPEVQNTVVIEGMNFNPNYNEGEYTTIFGKEITQEQGSQQNINPTILDNYSKDILETVYAPSCTKTINQREKICAKLSNYNDCNSSTCCTYNSYNGEKMCIAGDRNGPSSIQGLIDYYYYLGKCYPGKKACPNNVPQ